MLLGIGLNVSESLADSTAPLTSLAGTGALSEHEYGPVKPPPGYARLCRDTPEFCKPWTGKPAEFRMTAVHWLMLNLINTYVNRSIRSVTDQDLYGETEHWAYPTTAGDCEDFALLKQRYLIDLGFPANTVLMTVVLDENHEGHAVLSVASSDGDFILDNRRNDVRRWNETEYTFRKRQSERNPSQWVSLIRNGQQAPFVTAGGSAQ
jgi:predicted transglutaminase-like cysteine proteinase